MSILNTNAGPIEESQNGGWSQEWAQNNVVVVQAEGVVASAPPTRRRAPIACRRCRRMRTKCIHESAEPPCEGCRQAGPDVAAECVFTARGNQDGDRDFRRKRVRMSDVERTRAWEERELCQRFSIIHTAPQPVAPLSLSASENLDPWDMLPPYEELIEGCRVYGTSCIQLGFLPKALSLERLSKDRRSMSAFLLLSILSISARFTPSLIRRYGANGKAGEHFINCACQLVLDEMYEPTLERAQAFFLLGIAEWGRGEKNRSSIHMGIAVRMAGILRLHREETYELPPNSTADLIVDSEVARRTFWSIQCHDNLYTEHNAPLSFTRSDITTLLPCEESDFAFGRLTSERAALAGTHAAELSPKLTSLESRSLFATLIQVHNLWGQVARRASRASREKTPWLEQSEYQALTRTLKDFEDKMPDRHRWSIWNFRGYKTESVELPYLSVVTIMRLNNILIRRVYLEDILLNATKPHKLDPTTPPKFWELVSYDLFSNLGTLSEAIDTFFTLRQAEEGYPTMLVFCVYICGSLASYLWKWPCLCPPLANGADKILHRCLEVLASLKHAWPQATTWLEALEKVAVPPKPHKGKERPLSEMSTQEKVLSDADGLYPSKTLPLLHKISHGEFQVPAVNALDSRNIDSSIENVARLNTENLHLLSNAALDHTNQQAAHFGGGVYDWANDRRMFQTPQEGLGVMPMDNFEADLSEFLQGNPHLGLMEGW